MSTTFTQLPVELLLSTLEYVCDERQSGSAFASVNRSLSRLLLPKARRITLKTSSEKWKSNEMRTKLLKLIDNPYHQISFIIDDESFLDSTALSTILSILGSAHTLSYDFFSFSFLELDTLFSTLQTEIKEKGFQLKNLHLLCGNIDSFDVIPGLESLYLKNCNQLKIDQLNFHSYKSLRSLKLERCDSIEDVACLDGIHDLELVSCPFIKDISCLNNNYRISIRYCDNVFNYSNSFRNSRFVDIDDDRTSTTISLNCQSLISFSTSSRSLILSTCWMRSLRFLSLDFVDNIKSLPPNRLQKVSIMRCPDFDSFENMENIQSIHLDGLDFTSLVGLGPKNQIITLASMRKLVDISSIKESTIIEIINCSLFLDNLITSLTQVKELRFTYYQYQSSFFASLKQLEALKELRVFALTLYLGSGISEEKKIQCSNEIRSLILRLRNVNKFLLCIDIANMVGEEFNEEFLVYKEEFSVNSMIGLNVQTVTLLRKIRQ